MTVTIAIPCYKQAQYLPEAIESALAQTYKDIEIIVVNDGSPDNTSEIAKRYPVKLIEQVNKGLASARNTAIMNASGYWFLPLDADDILLDTCVEKLVKKAMESEADIIGPSLMTFGLAREVTILQAEPKMKDFLSGNRLGYFSMTKLSDLKEIGGYSPRMEEGWEDLHLWFNLLSHGKRAVTVPEPLVLYRTKEESMWRESTKHAPKLWRQIFKDFPHLEPKEIKTL